MSLKEASNLGIPVTRKTASVDLSTLELVNPGPLANVNIANRVGVPEASHVVTVLLFIGVCRACEQVLNLLKTWFNHANLPSAKDNDESNRNQVEVILVSAHKRMEDFAAMVQDITNPFFAVPFASSTHRKLLEDFGVESMDDVTLGEPRVAFMEWIGARYEPKRALECETVDTRQIQKMGLSSLIAPINFNDMETRRLLNPPMTARRPEIAHAMQEVRQQCSFYYTEVRDNLFDLRTVAHGQKKYLESMLKVVGRICEYEATEEGVDAYNEAIETIRRSVGGVHLLELMGAGKAKKDDPEMFFGRLHKEPHPRIDCMSFALFTYNMIAHQRVSALQKRPFPVIHSSPYMIRIYYRTSTWTAIRERFPGSISELLDLVAIKAMNVRMETVRLFSENLNPMVSEPIFCDGITEGRGALYYTSIEEIANRLAEAPIEQGMRKIRIVVMGSRKLVSPGDIFRYARPAKNKEAVFDQVRQMVTKISSKGYDMSWIQETLKVTAAVSKLSEIEEVQDQMLRRIPVQKLHMKAAKAVIKAREALQKSGSKGPILSSSLEYSTLSQSPPGGLTLAMMADWERISYDEELLKALVDWFSDDFFSWLPPVLACQAGTGCPSAMYLMHTAMRSIDNDEFGEAIEHDVLKPYLLEFYLCNKCRSKFQVYRPLHDVNRIINFPQGRCAEHSKAFHLAATALGFESRMVTGRFRPRETYPDSDPRSQSLSGATSHAWNEIYLENRKEWVPVDVSANDSADKESGSLEVPKSLRIGHVDMFAVTPYRIFFAVAVNRDSALIVTDKYCTQTGDIEYAHSVMNDEDERIQVEAVSRIIAETDVNLQTDPGAEKLASMRKQRAHHMSRFEKISIEAHAKPARTNPRIGNGNIAPGPSGMDLKIIGGEIPAWRARRPVSIFHSYDKVMNFDHIQFRVCLIEVYREGPLVSDVRFGYCFYDKTVPSTYGTTVETMAGVDFGDSYWSSRRPAAVYPIGIDDWIVSIDCYFDDEGLLIDFRPTLANQLGVPRDSLSRPIVGFYGSRPAQDSPGIDFIGFYQLVGTSRSPSLSSSF